MNDEEKLNQIESLPNNTEQTGATQANRAVSSTINNDHSLDDVRRDNQFSKTSDALAKEKTKRRSKPLLVLVLTLVMAALGGIATLAVYKAYFEKQAVQPTAVQPAPPTSSIPAVQKLDAKTVLQKVTPGYTPDTEMPMQPIKVAGYDYYVNTTPTAAAKKDVAASQSPVEIATITKLLKEMGFEEKAIQPGDNESMLITNFSHKDVVCRATVTKTYNNPNGTHLVNVGCENMSRIVTQAAALKQFYTLLPPDQTRFQNALSGDAGKVTDSKTSGYATLVLGIGGVTDEGEAGMGGAALLFYQTPDKQWHYFLSSQSILSCAAYNSPDLKKAYIGEKCSDSTGKEMTVSL